VPIISRHHHRLCHHQHRFTIVSASSPFLISSCTRCSFLLQALGTAPLSSFPFSFRRVYDFGLPSLLFHFFFSHLIIVIVVVPFFCF